MEQELLPDGRPVQLGGEVVADWMAAYLELVGELGLTLEPSYTALGLPYAWGADEGVAVGERAPWMADADEADLERVESRFAALARSVDPTDPWGHAEAERLDRASVGQWLRSMDARPGVIRLLEPHGALALDRLDRAHLAAGSTAQGGRGRRRTASTTRAAGKTCAWPRARPRWRCAWPPSSPMSCGSAAVVEAIDVARRALSRCLHAGTGGGERSSPRLWSAPFPWGRCATSR